MYGENCDFQQLAALEDGMDSLRFGYCSGSKPMIYAYAGGNGSTSVLRVVTMQSDEEIQMSQEERHADPLSYICPQYDRHPERETSTCKLDYKGEYSEEKLILMLSRRSRQKTIL
ncbi:hypothetical protein RF11_15535 [Thelohanellus kitauei]|uniref:Uncharacterized protein n=1 Tax=Thelohanellus kitauei TaxID=669202 RepID=A0A0C2MQU4_THEKT|nr:hypothetical protein RF11_15535 [Thelohanellus kitauei]